MAAMRSRRGVVSSRTITLTEPATGTAGWLPTPSTAPPSITLAIVVKPDSEIAVR